MEKLFLISDNHFGAADVIPIFHRPFEDVEEMDDEMIRRWNKVVRPGDTIISLGDFAWGPEDTGKYLAMLNGKKILIRGNHDWGPQAGPWSATTRYKEHTFILTHDPAWIPQQWAGWAIFGHHHWREEYPFFSRIKKSVCVACERVNYQPVEIGRIASLVESNAMRIEVEEHKG